MSDLRKFRMIPVLVLLGGMIAMPAFAQPAAGQSPAEGQPGTAAVSGTLLSVSAQGEASRVPDIASMSVGVVTRADEGDAAMRDNATRMNRVMASIRAAGIAEADIQTTGVSLHPQYRHVRDEAPRVTGYEARNTVRIKVRDLSRLGDVLDTLAKDGANQIHGPSFEIDEPEPVHDEARLAALTKAQARARTYADALGLQVRRIVSISEGGGGFHPMPMMAMARAADSAESTPVSPGESTVSVNLDVVFELGR